VVIILGEIFYVLDENGIPALQKAIKNLFEWQKEDGVLFSPIPAGNWDNELPAQMLAAVGKYGLWKYYEYTGDKEMLGFAFPYLQKYLSLWEFKEDGGVIHRPGGWSWYDWGDEIDVDLLDQLWAYQAFESAAKIADLLGEEENAKEWSRRAKGLENVISDKYWQGDKYASPEYEFGLDDRANGLAAALGFAEDGRWDQMKENLFNTRKAGPYMEKYVIEAFYANGEPSMGMKRMLDRYSEMIDSPITTLWEGWQVGSGTYGGGSYNHGWSGWPINIVGEHEAGVSPYLPGYEKVRLSLIPGQLNAFQASMPIAGDLLQMEYFRDEKEMHYQYKFGQEQECVLIFTEAQLQNLQRVNLNGKTMSSKELVNNGTSK
jgi:alpha-L-rhamnosidase